MKTVYIEPSLVSTLKESRSGPGNSSGNFRKSIKTIVLLLTMLVSVSAFATHFRGGTLSWQQGGGNNIKFTFTSSWRRGFFTTTSTPILGQSVNISSNGDRFYFGDGSSVTMSATVVAEDIAGDVISTSWTVTHLYPAAGSYVVNALNSSSRLTALIGNSNAAYNLQTVVQAGSTNNSPVSSLPTIINLPINAPAATFTINATDPDGDAISYRMAKISSPSTATNTQTTLDTTRESGLATQSPPGFTLSSTGVVTMNTNGLTVGNLYAVQVMVVDKTSAGVVKSKTPVDFIIKMVAASSPPVFTAPTTTSYTVPIGAQLSVVVTANSPDANRFVTLSPVSIPVGATMSPALPVSGPAGGSVSSTLSWTPSSTQTGSYVITFVAQNDVGIQAFKSISIVVPCALDFGTNVTNATCAGKNNGAATTTLSNFSSASNLSFQWTGPNNFSASTQNISGVAGGTYTFSVSDGATGCVRTNTVVIPNTITLTPTATSNSPVSAGGTINLAAAGTTSYSWTGPNSFTSTSQNPFITNASALNAGTYIVTGSSNGCSATASTIVVVNTPPATALNFDGVNDYLLSANKVPVIGSHARTVEFNAKCDASGDQKFFFTYGNTGTNGASFGLSTYQGELRFYGWGNAVVDFNTGYFIDANWHHYAVTYDGSLVKVYVDGVETPVSSQSRSLNTTSTNLFVGQRQDNIYRFSGTMDEFRLWDRALCMGELLNNMNSELPNIATQNGLITYYKFNQGFAGGNNPGVTTATDSKGTNNATLTNFALTGTTSNWTTGIATGTAPAFVAPVVVASSNSPVIAGGDINLTASGTATYSWSGPNGYNSTLQNLTISNADATRAGTYTVTGTVNGCSATATTNVAVNFPATGLDFDGGDDYIATAGPLMNNLAAFTVEGWVNARSLNNYSSLFGQNDLLEFSVTGSFFYIYTPAGNGVINYTLPLNSWHHIALAASGTTINLYVDGTSVGSVNVATSNYGSSSSPFTIGAYVTDNIGGLPYPFDGQFDEVRLWNRALCQGEIQNNMSNELSGAQPGLVTYYKLNHGFIGSNNTGVTIATDASGNGNDGTLNNFALTGNTSNWTAGIVSGTAPTFAAPSVSTTASGSITFCPSGSVNLTATPANAASPAYQWYKDGIAIPNADAYTYTAKASGSYTVTVTSQRCSGTSAPITVTVEDLIAPVAPVLADVTGECSATAIAPTTTDNCSGTITGTTEDPLTYTAQGDYVIHWVFDDGNGNITHADQNVSIHDLTAPLIPVLPDAIGECSAAATVPSTTDNCAGTVPGTTNDPLTYSTQGTHIIHWTFNDGNGNITTADQNVIVQDITAPVTPILEDVTGECSAGATVPSTTDNCAGTVTGTTADALTYTTQGTHIIHWTFNDGNGNTTTADQNVIVRDVTRPVAPVLADVTGECSATATVPSTTDNCAGTVVGTTTDALTYSTQGSYIIHWSFNDGNGNITTADQNVIVKDVTRPVAPVLADVTGECSATATVPSTTDNCAGTVVGTTTDALSYSTQGTHLIHWSFNDGNGNITIADQNVIVKDVTRPVAPVLADVKGECSATATAPSTTDNCAGTVVGTTTDALSYSTQGTHVIHWSFNDGNGNVTTADQNVIVKDVTAPVAPVLATLNGQCSVTATAPTTTDNCAGTITGTTSDPLTYTTQGSRVIHWTFNDGNGNITTANQNVVVLDNTKPVVVTKDITVTLVNGTYTVTPVMIDNGSSDNCGVANVSLGKSTFTCNNLGANTVTLTVLDVNGNSNSKTATVTVIGAIPTPTIAVSRTDNTFTGEDAKTIVLGYGAQKVTLTPSNGTNTATYSWASAAGLIPGANGTAVFTPAAAGSYTFTVTAMNAYGCTNAASVIIKVIEARCGNGKVNICHLPDNNLLHENTLCIDASAIAAHLAKGCRLGACASGYRPIAAVENEAKEFTVRVAPNPSTDQFRIAIQGSNKIEKTELRVLDLQGRIVEVKKGLEINKVVVVGANLQPGAYIVEVVQGANRKQLKLLKTRN